MPILKRFSTPAHIKDFLDHGRSKAAAERFADQWSGNLNRFTEYSLLGNPWTHTNDWDRRSYVNPLGTDIPSGASEVLVKWPAFPGRLLKFCAEGKSKKSLIDIYRVGDYGNTKERPNELPLLPSNPCDIKSPLDKPYNLPGPRGWQEEYCEWSVERKNGKLVKITFTCENPEYWHTVWKSDPTLVLELYKEILGDACKGIQLEDLYLRNKAGKVVIDQQTGQPGYNPINRWNAGPHLSSKGGGAIHLTCPINSLLEEINEGIQGVTLRRDENGSVLPGRDLICVGQIGGVYRNSDPHIVQAINQAARAGIILTINDPIGLYIQEPDFSRFRLPEGKGSKGFQISDCWTLVRGTPSFGLHAEFKVPAGENFSLEDILVDNMPLQYGGQVAATIDIGIHAVILGTGEEPPEYFPVEDVTPGAPFALQPLTDANVFAAQDDVGLMLNFQPPKVPQGTQDLQGYVLPCSPNVAKGATVSFGDPDVTATTLEVLGAKDPSTGEWQSTAIRLAISVAAKAKPGVLGVLIQNPGQTGERVPSPGSLEIVAS